MSMTRTQIYVPTDLYQQAKAMALVSNMTISQLVREGLEKLVAERSSKKNAPKQDFSALRGMFGKGTGPKTDHATHHNDIYL
jgi:hypothetical protein